MWAHYGGTEHEKGVVNNKNTLTFTITSCEAASLGAFRHTAVISVCCSSTWLSLMYKNTESYPIKARTVPCRRIATERPSVEPNFEGMRTSKQIFVCVSWGTTTIYSIRRCIAAVRRCLHFNRHLKKTTSPSKSRFRHFNTMLKCFTLFIRRRSLLADLL